MSEFTVCRTLDTHPALRYCLLLDDDRIAGGKPDYRGNNILISWRTKETYGPVGDLLAENAKLRELATYALRHIVEVWCEGEGRDLYRGKPCEDCVDYGSSDCPKCMPRVFDVSGIEVD